MNMYIPIAIIVLSNIFYHICSKSTPENVSPFAALTVTYLVGAAFSAVLFFILNPHQNFFAELKNINWSTWILGLAIVGLEAGSIYMYKAGWEISTGQLVHSAILAICLIIIGAIFYKEPLTAKKLIGIGVCMAGLFLMNS